ncbi:MAG: hypothetical protein V4550_12270 [Gemmatimonadota bacterium]
MHLLRQGRLGVLAVMTILAVGAVPHDAPRAREVARIRAHFDSVLKELSKRDIRDLATGARSNRAELIAELRRYRDAGAFPVNRDFADAVPYFVDRESGVLCAVANLLAYSGRADIVGRVRRTNNNVWVADLKGDTAFGAWLERHGMTLAEAARIQVPYSPSPERQALGALGAGVGAIADLTRGQKIRNGIFFTAAPIMTGGAIVTSLLNATWNADGHRIGPSQSGIVFGAFTTFAGQQVLAKTNLSPTIGRSAMAVGVGSIALSTLSMRRHSRVAALESKSKAVVADAELLPTIDAQGRSGARIGMSLRF